MGQVTHAQIGLSKKASAATLFLIPWSDELGWKIPAEIKHIVVGQHTIEENNMTIDWAYLRKG